MYYSDQDIVHRLQKSDQSALKYLFDVYYKDLVAHAVRIVINRGIAEETVQDVFIGLWTNRNDFILKKTFHAYLFTAVRNRSINYLKSLYGRTRFGDLDLVDQNLQIHSAEENLSLVELKEEIYRGIQQLPPKCKIIFILSRNSELSVDEIALRLNISKKTVQTQIGIAIKKIKTHLEGKWDRLP